MHKLTFYWINDIFLSMFSGKGRIVDTYASDFAALSEKGQIVVEVENIGDNSAEFSVSS